MTCRSDGSTLSQGGGGKGHFTVEKRAQINPANSGGTSSTKDFSKTISLAGKKHQVFECMRQGGTSNSPGLRVGLRAGLRAGQEWDKRDVWPLSHPGHSMIL